MTRSAAEPWVVAAALVLPMAAAGVGDRLDPFLSTQVGLTALAVGWVALLGYLIRRSDRPASEFGLARPRWLADGWAAAVLVPGLWLTAGWVASACRWAGMPDPVPAQPHHLPMHDWQWPVYAVGVLATGLAEELLYRGYLQTQLGRHLGSPAAGWFVSACLFAAAHAYHGPTGVLICLSSGLVLGAAFAATGRLGGPVLGHAGYNLLLATVHR